MSVRLPSSARVGAADTAADLDRDVPADLPARIPTPKPGAAALARFSLNQRSVPGWEIPDLVAALSAAGVPAVGLWREPVAETGTARTAGLVADAGLRVSSLCRGGFFTGRDAAQALTDNRRAVDEAAALGAATLVLVVGGLPAGSTDLGAARRAVADGLAALVPYARDHGVRLGLEPMHPVYTADRGVLATLGEALDLAERYPPEDVGVVVDTFHVWWDPALATQLRRAGSRIVSYQVADWVLPLPADTLLARGVPGDGHVDFAAVSALVAAAGYTGDVETEVFNADLWAAPRPAALATILRRHAELVAPHL